MAENGYVDHENLRGQRVRDRARLIGYLGEVGENIAWSAGDPKAALGAWMVSSGHCSNLMDPRYREAGIGVARSPTLGLVWVLVLGSGSR